jgi:hypothetical protein
VTQPEQPRAHLAHEREALDDRRLGQPLYARQRQCGRLSRGRAECRRRRARLSTSALRFDLRSANGRPSLPAQRRARVAPSDHVETTEEAIEAIVACRSPTFGVEARTAKACTCQPASSALDIEAGEEELPQPAPPLPLRAARRGGGSGRRRACRSAMAADFRRQLEVELEQPLQRPETIRVTRGSVACGPPPASDSALLGKLLVAHRELRACRRAGHGSGRGGRRA